MHTLAFERSRGSSAYAWILDGLERGCVLLAARSACPSLLAWRARAARLLSLRAAEVLAARPASAASARAKLAGARFANASRARHSAPRPLGLTVRRGQRRSKGAGGLYRASVGSTISGGSAEILQVVIARRGLGLR